MNQVSHFLVPELVPLENKGEEAIVRGIGDVIFPDQRYEIHLFDEVDEYYFKNGIHVYPVKWFMSPWLNREFCLGLSYEKLRDSFQSLVRNLLHKFYPKWVVKKDSGLIKTIFEINAIKEGRDVSSKYRGLENLLKVNYIVAGHDGAMDERVCHVIEEMKKIFNIPLGVFGIEFPQKFKSDYIVSEQYRVLKDAMFFYCRTDASKQVVDKYFPTIEAQVMPDPAFGMSPAELEEVDAYLDEKGLLELFDKETIVCTTCETGPISRYCFESISSPSGKLESHRDFYGKILESITSNLDVNILFLPHAIGPGKALDDRHVAREVISRVANNSKIYLLDDDISGVLLKGIIAKSDFLIAERIHSMIGAVGVNTPFLCLGSETDRRIHGILFKMVGAKDNIVYMNNPCLENAIEKFNNLWLNREAEKNRLHDVSDRFYRMHSEARERILREFSIK